MKIKLLAIILIFNLFFSNAQSNKELANMYLKDRGELAFTFTANNIEEIQQLANIVSFDHGQDYNSPFTIKAIANREEFNQFLEFNLPFLIDKKLNEPKEVVMFNSSIHKEQGVSAKNATYTLSFPLTAYPTYAQYAQQMVDFATDHPLIAQLVDIGGTVEGAGGGNKRLLFIKLSDNVNTREKEPRVMYTSSMHGDEIAGFPSMLNLIDYFITAYENVGNPDHTRVKNLLDNSEVWINPMANPDGTYYNDASNTTVAGARRYNANGVDLNRNYSKPGTSTPAQGGTFQTETVAFMNLATSTHFVIAANFHGGSEALNYPWDYTYDRHPDDTWWQLVSKEYAQDAQAVSPAGYLEFNNGLNSFPGITHGADWYKIDGGRQDYMNFEKHTKEETIELSMVKLPPASPSASDDILDLWNYNKESYIKYLIQGTFGFQGVVKDASTGNPIKAKVTLVGHDALGSWVETELPLGDYYRPINAGTYDILYEADCYIPKILKKQIITDYQTILLPDVLLQPLTTSSTLSNLSAYSLKTTSATITWDNVMNASLYNIQYRKVGAPSWTTTTSTVNFKNLTGLTASSTYEFQVTAKCNSVTTSWSSIQTFNTMAIDYCNLSSTDRSTGYIGQVQVGTINNVSSASGYSDFTNLFLTVDKGNTISVAIAPVWTPTKYNEAYSIWIDYNQDGDFNDVNEQVWSKTSSKTRPVTGSFTIPTSAIYGSTRMRVSMKYYTSANQAAPTSCESFTYGEIEDYTINIADATLGIEDEILSAFLIYPNPVSTGKIRLKMPNDIYEFHVTISNVFGQELYAEKVRDLYKNTHTVNAENYKSGIYFITVKTDLGKATKKLIIQ